MRVLFTFFFALFFCTGYAFPETTAKIEVNTIDLDDDQDDLEDAIESALSYIRKALNSSTLSDIQYYARKAKNYASDAEDIADDLEMDDVEDYCYKAYKYARAAESETSIDTAIDYLYTARKALQNAYNEL